MSETGHAAVQPHGADQAGNLRDRTRMVRAELRGCGAFTEVSRGRWMPGKPSGYEAAPLPLIEVMDYMDRLHKDTVRKP